VTTGDWIGGVIIPIVIALIGGGWALYRYRAGRRKTSLQGVPQVIDGGSAAPDVDWRIEHRSGSKYALRNTGSDTAEHVYVDESRVPALNRGLPKDTAVPPNDAVDIMLTGSWQSPMPSQIYLRWNGQPDWVAVAIT
jgi:hypothetical protein